MYYLLTERFKDQEQLLVDIIKKNASVLKIYFLGSTLLKQRTESIFMPDAPGRYSVDQYHLLIVVENNQKGTNFLQDKIENSCEAFIPVTAIVQNEDEFTRHFFEGNHFIKEVLSRAVILYECENCDLPKSAPLLTHGEPQQNYTNSFKSTLINEFIEGASFYIKRGQNRLALFLLHQALEQGLNYILKVKVGLHFSTHNLDKLFRYAAMADYRIGHLFPKDKDANKRIFALVHRAYHDSRYKEEYMVPARDVGIILERTRRMSELIDAMQQ